jgi:hypothetical protein
MAKHLNSKYVSRMKVVVKDLLGLERYRTAIRTIEKAEGIAIIINGHFTTNIDEIENRLKSLGWRYDVEEIYINDRKVTIFFPWKLLEALEKVL